MNEDEKAYKEAEALLSLIHVDFRLLQLNKELDELPQRPKILELRAKLRELEGKLDQVTTMEKENDRALRLLRDEEASASDRCKEIQAKIAASINYKETSALTKELNSYNQRIENIETETLKNLEKLDKINEVESQVTSIISKLRAQEADHVAQFKELGGALKEAIARETSTHQALCARLPEPVVKRYEKAIVAKGGVGAAFIDNGCCSGCHLPLSEGQIISFKGKGPLAECPHCHRLLVTIA